MVYYKKVAGSTLDDFRLMRQQSTTSFNPESSSKKRGVVNGHHLNKSEPNYTELMRHKMEDINNYIEDFTPFDLVTFFKVKAEDSNSRYVISNGRDCGAMKKLQKNFSNEEICLMVEFMFESDQNYLDKKTLQPTVLISGWQTTIFNDSQLWFNDEYTPKKKTKKEKPKREWSGDNKNTAKIGEW